MAELYEKLLQDSERNKAELMAKYEEQAKTRDEKLIKLRIDNSILSTIQRRTAQTMI